MRMIHVTYPGEWVCMCARGGARGWACSLNSTHTCTHIYTYTQVAYVYQGGEEGVIDVVSPERGWEMPHWFMYECFGSYTWMCQWAPELYWMKVRKGLVEWKYGKAWLNESTKRPDWMKVRKSLIECKYEKAWLNESTKRLDCIKYEKRPIQDNCLRKKWPRKESGLLKLSRKFVWESIFWRGCRANSIIQVSAGKWSGQHTKELGG